MAQWVPLHVHSQYSILDALASIQDIAEKSAELGMPAVALTDHGNLYGAVEFYKACKSFKIKPILGCEVYVAPESRFDKKKEYGSKSAFHLGLLAKNREGYQNLIKLSSLGFLEGFYYHPRIDTELLKQHAKGLICLSGCLSSRVAHEALNGTKDSLIEQVKWYRDLFGEDFYLELQRQTMTEEAIQADGMHLETWLFHRYQDFNKKQTQVNALLLDVANELKIKVVATNDSHYIHRKDWKAHEILLNIQSGEPCEIWEKDSYGNPKMRVSNPKRRTYPSHEFYFKSSEEMAALFADCPEALVNTLEVADKCELELDFNTKHYPVFTPPSLEGKKTTKEERAEAVESFLWQLCEEGIKRRYTEDKLNKIKEIFPNKEPIEVVRERLCYEMSIIVPKEMSDYLLIVWDFINWAKTNSIPMGPGRGSGAGSIVLYLIGVTDIEPLRFHLFFERFINPERIAYPDIDVDICMDRRSDVINYVLKKYGKDNIAQIITFGTMKAKMTIKDVGRVLSVPLSKVNEIAKLIPDDLNITLEKAVEKDQDLRNMMEHDEDTRRIIEIGKTLEGSIRNTGIHAAGIIISGEPLTHFIPVCTAKDSDMPVTQFSMKPVEMVGMLKVDFLGLKTLTAIQQAVNHIKSSQGGPLIDWVNLPLDDSPTFDLLNQGKTLGVFQLESGGMQDLSRHLRLDKFEEIIAVGALYRPGPMDMIPSFINRKHGKEVIENDHPWMNEILSETYGIMVYQEQVMQIASKLANFTLAEGDVLRRAMGKKDGDQMSKQREKFKNGALENHINEDTSMMIFDKIEKFASYGFNKSHAAAYGYLSYVTAYLKANFPKEWMAALMTCDSHDLSKVSKFIRECQSMDIAVLPPDVNESGKSFMATPQGIRFAMSGIKGVGEGVVEVIIQERERHGRFDSLYHFLKRVDTRKIGKKTVEGLIEAGCFDFTKWPRESLKHSLEPMYESVSSEQKDASLGYLNLFSLVGDLNEERFLTPPQVRHPASKLDILLKEKDLLGFFLTGHPMDSYRDILQRLSSLPLSKGASLGHDAFFRAAFIVESVQIKLSSKNSKKFAILTIGDGYDSFEVPIWSELYEEKSHLLRENQLLYAVLQVDGREELPRLSCRWLEDLTKTNEAMIEACDQAYDKLKQQASRSALARSFKNSPRQEKKAPKEEKPPPMLNLKLNLEALHLSQILGIKDVFEKHRGPSPVAIEFVLQGRAMASLSIDSRLGVNVTPHFKADLKNILPDVECN